MSLPVTDPEVAGYEGIGVTGNVLVVEEEVSDVIGENVLRVDKDNKQEQKEIEEYWEEMKASQERDVECSRWMQELREGTEVRVEGGRVLLDEGVLMWETRELDKRLVVPVSQRVELLRLVHENALDGGHFHAAKGLAKLRKRWWWQGMRGDIEQWVRACRLCQLYKHSQGRRGSLPRDTPRVVPEGPWDSVYVDAVGPLTEGRGGYLYILVALDHFTRWIEMVPV
jgi:hypothetical protein